jgi:hypothetical protein
MIRKLESAARTLEYAYADFCIARLAESMGWPQEEIEKFKKIIFRSVIIDLRKSGAPRGVRKYT